MLLKYWKLENIKDPIDTIFQGVLKRMDGKENRPYMDVIVFKDGTTHLDSNTNSPVVELTYEELKEIADLIKKHKEEKNEQPS